MRSEKKSTILVTIHNIIIFNFCTSFSRINYFPSRLPTNSPFLSPAAEIPELSFLIIDSRQLFAFFLVPHLSRAFAPAFFAFPISTTRTYIHALPASRDRRSMCPGRFNSRFNPYTPHKKDLSFRKTIDRCVRVCVYTIDAWCAHNRPAAQRVRTISIPLGFSFKWGGRKKESGAHTSPQDFWAGTTPRERRQLRRVYTSLVLCTPGTRPVCPETDTRWAADLALIAREPTGARLTPGRG